MNKKKCRACGCALKDKPLLTLSGMPKAVQNLPAGKDEARASGIDLDVSQCPVCELVQLTNAPVSYYKDTIRAGSASPLMLKRQRDEFNMFIERFSLQGKNVLEIGSGRGEYLSVLNELPVNAFGMEHNQEYNKIANEKGLKTFQAYPADLTDAPDNILFDAFISINFLEHAPDPGRFLRACAALLSEDGVGMVAVPDLEFELRDNFLYSFMIDHLCYFTAGSLRNLLTLNGFDVVDVFRNDKLNVVTTYFKKRRPYDLAMPIGKVSDFNKQINNYIDLILGRGGRIALWGASHLAFSIISLSGIGSKISYIVDSAPFKQGKFAPVSGLEIFPPQHLNEDPAETIIIMCPEYSAEIVTGIKEKYSGIVRNIATFKNGGLEIVQ